MAIDSGYTGDVELTQRVADKTRRLLASDPDGVLAGSESVARSLPATSRHVLDFGGGAGLAYFIARYHLPRRKFRWAVVEVPEMVAAAVSFEDVTLKFFERPETAAEWLGGIDLLYSNGAIQYVDDPELMIARLLALRPQAIIWDRVLVGASRSIEEQFAPLSAHGPGPVDLGDKERILSHTAIRLAAHDFERMHIELGYRCLERGDRWRFRSRKEKWHERMVDALRDLGGSW